MDSFKIYYRASAERDLRRLPRQAIQTVVDAINQLKKAPFSPKTVKVKGREGLYRLRVGDYRVIYEVLTNSGLISITRIRHRREAYRF